MTRQILIIDPQVAFCSTDGSMAKAFGKNELTNISERLTNLEAFLESYPLRNEISIVKSEYLPGQFTNGDLQHPYSQACVPRNADDCALSLSQRALKDLRIFTKYEESAASVSELVAMLQSGQLKEVLVAGFLTTSCVRKTALALRNVLPNSITIGILEDLTASRASNYESVADSISRHEAALEGIRLSGITVVQSASLLS